MYIYTIELYSAMKKKNNAICSNMDATRASHIKWSKSKRERQISYAITYMWNLKYGTKEPVYRKKKKKKTRHIDTEDRLVKFARGEGEGVAWMGSLGWVDVNYSA